MNEHRLVCNLAMRARLLDENKNFARERLPQWKSAPSACNSIAQHWRQASARSLDENAKFAVEELPSGGGAAAIAATGSTHTVRATPSQAGLLLLSSQPEKLPCAPRRSLASALKPLYRSMQFQRRDTVLAEEYVLSNQPEIQASRAPAAFPCMSQRAQCLQRPDISHPSVAGPVPCTALA